MFQYIDLTAIIVLSPVGSIPVQYQIQNHIILFRIGLFSDHLYKDITPQEKKSKQQVHTCSSPVR